MGLGPCLAVEFGLGPEYQAEECPAGRVSFVEYNPSGVMVQVCRVGVQAVLISGNQVGLLLK